MAYRDPEERRAAGRRHYEKNSDYYKQKARRRNKRIADENVLRLLDYLSEHPCVDCDEDDPVVLDFDHRDGEVKEAYVGTLVHNAGSWERVMREIEKCDVRCANCHRRKTARAGGWRKLLLRA